MEHNKPITSLTATYTNYKGETADRKIKPLHIYFGESKFHEGQQWFLRGLDLDKNQERDFAVKDFKEHLLVLAEACSIIGVDFEIWQIAASSITRIEE